MTTKKKKALDTDLEDENEEVEVEQLSTLDRLSNLRRDIVGNSGLTELIDILIDGEGGDSAELATEIAADRLNADNPDVVVDTDTITRGAEPDFFREQ